MSQPISSLVGIKPRMRLWHDVLMHGLEDRSKHGIMHLPCLFCALIARFVCVPKHVVNLCLDLLPCRSLACIGFDVGAAEGSGPGSRVEASTQGEP